LLVLLIKSNPVPLKVNVADALAVPSPVVTLAEPLLSLVSFWYESSLPYWCPSLSVTSLLSCLSSGVVPSVSSTSAQDPLYTIPLVVLLSVVLPKLSS